MLEQDFENEINKKNTSMKEVGQVMNSIENIYKVACDLAKDRNRPNLPQPQEINPEAIVRMLKDSVE